MKTLECENVNCRKKLRKVSLNCLKCNFKYCSEKCLEVHKLTQCQDESSYEEESMDSPNIPSNSFKTSRFLKTGIFQKILDINPIYDYDNFEIVSVGNNPQTIGHGLYGDLYLGKNKINKKLYCIKRVPKF